MIPDPLRPVQLLTPGEVAKIFAVDPKTVTRWAAAGKIDSIRTPGGHHRFRADDIERILNNPAALADITAADPAE